MSPTIVLLIITLIAGVASPPLVDATIGDQIYPDNPLYEYERFGEAIRLKLAEIGIGNYTAMLDNKLDERLEELTYCLEKHTCTVDIIHKLMYDYNNTITLLVQHLITNNKTNQLNQIKLKLQQHKQRIHHILETQITTGIGEVEITIHNTIQTINNKINELEIHIKSKHK